MNDKKTISALSVDTQMIYKLLQSRMAAQPDGFVAYDEILHLLHSPKLTERVRGYISTARRILRSDGIETDVVRGEGLKRVSGAAFADLGDASVEHVRRHTRRTCKRMAVASDRDIASMSAEELKRYNASISVSGALYQATSRSALKRIADKVQETKDKLSFTSTLEMFLRA